MPNLLTALAGRRALRDLEADDVGRELPMLTTTKSRAVALALKLGLLAVITAAAGGCGSGLPEGPLGVKAENHTTLGQPVRRGGADTIGFDVVYNSGSAPAVIDRLVIRSPRDIKLVGAALTIGGIIGDWATYPPRIPSGQRYAFRAWADRHRPAGATIPPHQWAGIALGLETTGAHGSIAGVNLFYHVGSAHYEWHGHVRIVLTSVDCRAPSSKPDRTFCRL
ncbi:MAG TPA: hypothetical protein VF843_05455 [Streptosporangiaceae bacterium]